MLVLAARRPYLQGLGGFLALGVTLGSAHGLLWQHAQLSDSCIHWEGEFSGRVATLPRKAASDWGGWQISAEIDRVALFGARCAGPRRLRISQHLQSDQLSQALVYGSTIRGHIRLRPLSSQWNPGAIPDQARSASRGVDARGVIIGPLELLAAPGPVARWRLSVLGAWPESAGWDILRALLLGDTRSVTDQTWRSLRHLGIVHLIIISGLHISLLATLVSLLLTLPRRLWRIRSDCGGETLLVFGVLGVTGLYVLLVGATLPTVRAYLMLVAGMTPRLLGWTIGGQRALLLAIVALIVHEPTLLLGSSFWLSAAATWLLVSNTRSSFRPANLLLTQVQMVLVLAPITLFWFGEASWLGLATNALLIPVVTWIMVPVGLLGVGLSAFAPALSQALLNGIHALWQSIWGPLTELLACCASAGVVTGALSGLGFALGLAAVIWAGPRLLRFFLALLGVLCSVWTPSVGEPDVSVTLLDVGQGLSLVLESGGRTLIYDTGDGIPGAFSQAEKALLPYLRMRGADAIDVMIISHADRDHSGGIAAIREALPVIRHLGFAGEPCRNGERWRWGGTELTLINGPGHADKAGDINSNDSSCGLLINVGEAKLLVLGDVSAQRERQVVRYWRDELKASFLVLSHHGSRSSTSRALLKWVQPEVVWVSAARGNRFGHPHPEVRASVEAQGDATLLSTARVGAISVTMKSSGQLLMRTRRGKWSPYWLKLP